MVARRLVAAAHREGMPAVGYAGGTIRLGSRRIPADAYGFDRLEITGPLPTAPADLLAALGVDCPALRAELDDAVDHLALAMSRRAGIDAGWSSRAAGAGADDAYGAAPCGDPDAQAVAFEQLATEGHNLHPCGRTRLGWTAGDALAHDQESDRTDVAFVAIRADRHVGDDVGARLRDGYPYVPAAPDGYRLQPVHPWQLAYVLRDRHADLYAAGVLRDVPGGLAARPTTALRTLLLEPDRRGRRHYLKLSVDIQVTSTRRSISVASTRNGPVLAALLCRLVTDPRVTVLAEVAGAAMDRGRDVAAIVRDGIDTRMRPGEVAIPGAALPARSPVTGVTVLAEVVDRYAATRDIADPAAAALGFVGEYAGLTVPPLVTLLHDGVGFEAHLQNSIPVFRDGVPVRLVLRDLAGLRLHPGRLGRRAPGLWPGSVIATDDLDVVRAKLGYTLFQAHLGEVVLRLCRSHGLDETAAWRAVRAVLDRTYRERDLDRGDLAFLTAARMPHKALLRMRIADAHGEHGDIYHPVRNPLHG